MKKILCLVILAAIFLTMLCGRGNRTIIDTTWRFDTAIVQRADGEHEIPIKAWNDYENSDMIQITALDGTVYLTHSSNIILISK